MHIGHPGQSVRPLVPVFIGCQICIPLRVLSVFRVTLGLIVPEKFTHHILIVMPHLLSDSKLLPQFWKCFQRGFGSSYVTSIVYFGIMSLLTPLDHEGHTQCDNFTNGKFLCLTHYFLILIILEGYYSTPNCICHFCFPFCSVHHFPTCFCYFGSNISGLLVWIIQELH